MAELRQNVVTQEWVIISPERARRPDEFISERSSEYSVPMRVPDCPFCVGNEHLTLHESFRVAEGKNWKIRAIANKFPAPTGNGERIRKVAGIYHSMSAVGFHEVIVERPLHNITTALMTEEHVVDILKVYRQRYGTTRKDDRIKAIIIFRNHGETAGASILHPHSQLVAAPIVPSQIRNRMEEAIRYFDVYVDSVGQRPPDPQQVSPHLWLASVA